MTWEVEEWGSHPEANNDDCWTAHEYPSEAEARAAMACGSKDTSTAYLQLVRVEGNEIVEVLDIAKNPNFRPEKDDDWRREVAMEAGMLHGVEAYNEVMGWD